MSKGARVTQLHKKAVNAATKDLETQLAAAKKAQADKLESSRAHLAGQLKVASEKYLTVNGFMQARSTIQTATFGYLDGDSGDFDRTACEVAGEMSVLARKLALKLDDVSIMDLNESFLDGHLDKDFVGHGSSLAETVKQLLIVNLLQNIGPSIDDIIGFRESTNEAIAAIRAELEKQSGYVLEGQTSIDDVIEPEAN